MCAQKVWTAKNYNEDTNNCYSFVLTFLQTLNYGVLSETAFNRYGSQNIKILQIINSITLPKNTEHFSVKSTSFHGRLQPANIFRFSVRFAITAITFIRLNWMTS